jgi:hypothetical protein
MKGKAFFEKVTRQGKIVNEDFNKVLETFPDVEIPDVFVNLFEETFLTRERAAADPVIHKKIKGEVLNGVDANLANITLMLDVSDQEAINKEENSFKKIELIKAAIPKLIEKSGKSDVTLDDKYKQLEKERNELVGKINEIKTESDKKLTDLTKTFEEKEKGMKIDWTLDKQFGSFVFADEFAGLKEAIIKSAKSDIKDKNFLTLDENGQIVVNELVGGVPKVKFNGNDQVTIDSLITEPLKPFLKKNNNGSDNGQEGKKTVEKTIPASGLDKDPSQMTLGELRKHQRANTTVQ